MRTRDMIEPKVNFMSRYLYGNATKDDLGGGGGGGRFPVEA